MRFLGLINRGFEDIAAIDVKESIKSEVIEKLDSAIIFDAESFEACKYCYTSQIAIKIINLIQILKFKNLEENTDQDLIVGNLFNDIKNKSFKVESKIISNKHDSDDINYKIDSSIGKMLENQGLKVDLENPEIIINAILIEDNIYVGVDLSGDLSKRDYRIFNSPQSVKGTTAFGLLMISGYKKDDVLLDPYCNSGTIAIEAALHSRSLSHKFYNKNMPFVRMNILNNEDFFKIMDKESRINPSITAADPLLKNTSAAKKNAKIAGVEKFIEFRRIDIDWMDLKNDKDHFDKMITFIPGSSKHREIKAIMKDYDRFFYQSEYILKDSGVLSVLCLSKDLLIKAASPYFSIIKEHEFYSGHQLMHILMFKKLKLKKSENQV